MLYTIVLRYRVSNLNKWVEWMGRETQTICESRVKHWAIFIVREASSYSSSSRTQEAGVVFAAGARKD